MLNPIFSGPVFIFFSLVCIFFVLLNPHIGLPYFLTFAKNITNSRISAAVLKFKSIPDSLFTQYNGVVVFLSIVLFICFWLGLLYFFFWFFSNRFKNSSKVNKWIIYFLKCLILLIFLLSLWIKYYYNLPMEFADKAVPIYEALYNKELLIYKGLWDLPINMYIYLLAGLGKIILSYIWILYIVHKLELIQFKLDLTFLKSSKFEFSKLIYQVILLICMIWYVQLVSNYILYSLKILPFTMECEYSLPSLIELNNLAHTLFLISVSVIIISYLLIYLVNNFSLFNKEINNWIIAFFELTLLLGFYAMFIIGLFIFYYYIPNGIISIGYRI